MQTGAHTGTSQKFGHTFPWETRFLRDRVFAVTTSRSYHMTLFLEETGNSLIMNYNWFNMITDYRSHRPCYGGERTPAHGSQLWGGRRTQERRPVPFLINAPFCSAQLLGKRNKVQKEQKRKCFPVWLQPTAEQRVREQRTTKQRKWVRVCVTASIDSSKVNWLLSVHFKVNWMCGTERQNLQ